MKAAKRSLGGIAREQGTSGINILLALAGVLTLITGSPTDSGIILGLLMLNIGLSVFEEYRAERALDALRALLPINVHVWRDGAEMLKPAADLVPGDVIAVRSGDIVPADARVLDADGLEIDQATLTGESVPQAKSVELVAGGPPTAWTDVLFAGTTAVSGEGLAVIVATGGMTQFGETASLVRDIQTPSDFQVNLAHFGTFLLRFGIGLAVVVFIANALLGHGVLVSLTLALTLMLGMVPEALPAVTATTLAIGAARLARQKVLGAAGVCPGPERARHSLSRQDGNHYREPDGGGQNLDPDHSGRGPSRGGPLLDLSQAWKQHYRRRHCCLRGRDRHPVGRSATGVA